MSNVQLYLAFGMPTFMIVIGIIVGLFQLNATSNQFNARFTELNGRFSDMNGRFTEITGLIHIVQSDLKELVRITNDLDVRIARLEERSTR